MDNEKLVRSIEAHDQAVELALQQQNEQSSEEQLIESRLLPFVELEQRNRALYENATLLTGAGRTAQDGPAPGTKHSRVAIVLGAVDSKNPNRTALAQVNYYNQYVNGGEHEYHFVHTEALEFKYFITDDEEYVSSVVLKPRRIDIEDAIYDRRELVTTGEKSKAIIQLPGTTQAAYNIGGGNTPIENTARNYVSGRMFSPIKAHKRKDLHKRVSGRLQGLESALARIDADARNPELNPVLAANLSAEALIDTVQFPSIEG